MLKTTTTPGVRPSSRRGAVALGLPTLALLALTYTAPAARADAATDVATQIKFVVNDANCAGTPLDFYVGSTLVASQASGNGCYCGVNDAAIVITDAAALAAVGPAGCTDVRVVRQNTGDYIAYIRAEITRSESGTESFCVTDYLNYSSAGGGSCESRDLCQGYSYGQDIDPGASTIDEFVEGPADIDGDGLNACVDLDLDNDGRPNEFDNCPSTFNAGQEDADGNGTGDACQPSVVAVPWAGLESKPHVVYSGGSLVLQAVATGGGGGERVALASATWDPGDGSGPRAISVANSRALELTHTYTGAVGQPYTATIRVVDAAGQAYTDTFKVQIQARSLDTETNMAIDRALWFEHKKLTVVGSGPTSTGYWTYSSDTVASTASTLQAFQVNGHRASGDPLKNPYVDNVGRGLRYLQTKVRRIDIAADAAGNPDSNGNGYGLEAGSGHGLVYTGGQVIDAFIASGNRTAVATLGTEAGRTYGAIAQDMLDAYAWGQHPDTGGWIYSWRDNWGYVDSSSSAWWGIGVHAGNVWDLSVPAFVKERNRDVAIPSLQYFDGSNAGSDGSCGYSGPHGSITHAAACMIMMSADGVSRDYPRYAAAERWIGRNWGQELHGYMYAMYNLAKALRTAPGGPITLLGGNRDWYGADPHVGAANPNGNANDPQNGLARHLVGTQNGDGSWNGGSWVDGPLSTAWGILILSPALFEQGPTAVCSIDASVVCQAGASGGCNTTGTNPYATLNLDARQSTAGDNAIATYSWNFQDGSALDASPTTTHSFSSLGTFAIQLTVTDTKGFSSSVTCPVQVTDTALPPIADPGAPQSICEGSGTVLLNAQASTGRGANIVSYEWDFSAPISFATIDATGAVSNQTAHFRSLPAGTYDVGLRVSDDSASHFTTVAYTTVTVLASTSVECADADADDDGVNDDVDNCSAIWNPTQTDTDGDLVGDVCDACELDALNDVDGDTVCGNVDNCPAIANVYQYDTDNEGQGDACDVCPLDASNDADGDGYCADVDNCAGVAGGQEDADLDGQGDLCDVCPYDAANDADGDGICAEIDNCPTAANAGQDDNDDDQLGDVCDPDDDNDGVLDGADNCLLLANANQRDTDGDGAGDVCDADDDGDGVGDDGDACPSTAMGAAVNSTGCGIADLCPCAHPAGVSAWKNHGAYVSCVAKATNAFRSAGLITEEQKGAIQSAAAQSTCGRR